ncbi:FABP4-like protein [Mya arenaria]|uniref:FABP4-like protein n=1 Tax=Mya arenaria TaxID=6604 RepID=A0ABY7DEL0_MYAAR|nr:FABP4-like protein [Mya arenaria]
MASEIKTLFEGKWTHTKSEKFEEYLTAIGIGYLKRKMAMSLSPTITISVDGEEISVNISAGPKGNESKFRLGQEFTVGGEMEGQAIATFEAGKLSVNITPKDSSKKKQTVTREIVDGGLVQGHARQSK